MTAALALSTFLTFLTQPSATPVFQPRLHVRILPARERAVQPADTGRDIVCGMVVIRKTPADDPKIVLPARETGAAVRRIEPQGCGAKTAATPK